MTNKKTGKTAKNMAPIAPVNEYEEKYSVMIKKYDHMKSVLDWAYKHPIKFALGRIYHQYIKRDQKNG